MATEPASKRARRSGTSTLEHLLGDGTSSAAFFRHHWEAAPLHLTGAHLRLPGWEALPSWESLLGVLRVATQAPQSDVLCLKDQHPTTEYPSPAAAYLDGASLIVNHAEVASTGVAALCRALRADDFPHAFGNLYVTPPVGRAVDAHADDRDVLVLQLEGQKAWRVYGPAPIPYPAPDEQVGKHGLPVPPAAVASSRLLFDATLHEGDVLYIPRGFVHEATTGADAPSLHLTLALPSHDWSWASLAAAAAANGHLPSHDDGPALSRKVRARELCSVHGEDVPWLWRRSVPPPLACQGAATAVGAEHAWEHVGAAIALELGLPVDGTLELLLTLLQQRSAVHSARQDAAAAEGKRLADALTGCAMVAPSSKVRRRRADEPEPEAATRPASDDEGNGGLLAREEFADALFATLARLTTAPVAVTSFDDAPLLDAFGKACFAQVCVDLGLLVVCSPD